MAKTVNDTNAQQLRGENSTLISQPLADSFPLKGEAGGEGQSAAATASPRGEAMSAADKEGRVVVLPCKVGDPVFARLDNKSKYVCECKVKQIVVGNIGLVTFDQ